MIKRVMGWLFFASFLSAAACFAQDPTAGSEPIDPGLTSTEFNLLFSTIKVAAALGLTLVLLILAVWLLKKIMSVRQFPGMVSGPVSLLALHYIAPKRAIALVRVIDRVLIIGVSDQSLTTLGELTPEEIGKLDSDGPRDDGVFRSILSGLTGKKR